jgi:hypothetical protein
MKDTLNFEIDEGEQTTVIEEEEVLVRRRHC